MLFCQKMPQVNMRTFNVTLFSMVIAFSVKNSGEIPQGTLLSVVSYKDGLLVAEDRSIHSTTSDLSKEQSKAFAVGKNVLFAITNAQGVLREDGSKIISLREEIEGYCRQHESEFADGRISQSRIDNLASFVETRFRWGLSQIANSQKVLAQNDASLFNIFLFYRDNAKTSFKMTRITLESRPTWRLAKDPELQMQEVPYFLAGDPLVTENILAVGGEQRTSLDCLFKNHSTIDIKKATELTVNLMRHAHKVAPKNVSAEFDLFCLDFEKGIDRLEV